MSARNHLAVFILLASAGFGRGQVSFVSGLLPQGSGPTLIYFTNDRSGLETGSEAGSVAINPSYLLITNGPQHWDFSEGPNNYVETISVANSMDIPADLRQAFPAATHMLSYAQNGADPGPSEEFYTKDANGNRHYLGFQIGTDSPVVFQSDDIDLPGVITNGMQWFRSTVWQDVPDGLLSVETQFNASTVVDGYGEILLPGLGTLPALRVHEIQEYQMSLLGIPETSYFAHIYYWIAEGVGKVVEIQSVPSATANAVPTQAISFLRAFASRDNLQRFVPLPKTEIRLTLGKAYLSWSDPISNSIYVVLQGSDLSPTNWNVIDATAFQSGSYQVRNDILTGFFSVLRITRSSY